MWHNKSRLKCRAGRSPSSRRTRSDSRARSCRCSRCRCADVLIIIGGVIYGEFVEGRCILLPHPAPFQIRRERSVETVAEDGPFTFEAMQVRSLYDSTFSRTVWRLYGGAKGLVMWYYTSGVNMLMRLYGFAATCRGPKTLFYGRKWLPSNRFQ